MRYATPELVVVGEASVLVQGIPDGYFDNGMGEHSQPGVGIALGLDD